MGSVKYYLMYVSWIRKVYVHYLCWNDIFRVDEHIISIWFLNYLISFRFDHRTYSQRLWSKYIWYDVNYHFLLIRIILVWINVHNFTNKSYDLINFRDRPFILQKYSLTCTKGVQNGRLGVFNGTVDWEKGSDWRSGLADVGKHKRFPNWAEPPPNCGFGVFPSL